MPKNFKCSASKGQHKRPTGVNCPFVPAQETSSANSSIMNSEEANDARADTPDLSRNNDILSALEAVSSRFSAIEHRIERTEERLDASPAQVGLPTSPSQASTSTNNETWNQDTVVPSVQTLKNSQLIQQQVDERLLQLLQLNGRGTCKSQRGGTDTVWVKRQTPWPQSFILGGPNKSRVSYDSLSVFQWVSGFCNIVKEESDSKAKNQMLEYISDLMDDAQDFGWNSAKASHAVLLCRMEESKVSWQETTKIDRIRRTHTQRQTSSQPSSLNPNKKHSDTTNPCKYFQNGTCQQKSDHITGGQNYKHVCAICNAYGHKLNHAAKDCRLVKQSKNE